MAYDLKEVSEQIRNILYENERKYLSCFAQLSSESRGRVRPENVDRAHYRLCYQRDRDRIIHSKPFRRLKGKTQVFLFPIGDHYRTRLTHTLEVSQISRTMARALRLNEDLTEAVALGHDLGHTPFGHLGEKALDLLVPGGFRHYVQSERIARDLNLTHEVCEGIRMHSKGKGVILDDNIERYSGTLEGQIVRVADIIAYINHDLDDATRAGILSEKDIPADITDVLGGSSVEKLATIVSDVITSTLEHMNNNFEGVVKRIYMSGQVGRAVEELKLFMFDNVYEVERVVSDYKKVLRVCQSLYEYFLQTPGFLLKQLDIKEFYDTAERVACDYISGMTDGYALSLYKKLFLPKPWLNEEFIDLGRF
ncbi:MAG: deoxyguanosinetriphosphate triphosphohydrolase [Oligoflexia bacterium]|nr:deoxyguanosinetriphosphate triphosphohydrolase [Oligoflexia bacterium]